MTREEYDSHCNRLRELVSERGPITDNQLRIFSVVCVRRIWHLLRDPLGHQAVETAEGFLNGSNSTADLMTAYESLTNRAAPAHHIPGEHGAMCAAMYTCIANAWWSACNGSKCAAEAVGEVALAKALNVDLTTGQIDWKLTTDYPASLHLGRSLEKVAMREELNAQLIVFRKLIAGTGNTSSFERS